jgi:hypothetical protein
MTFEFEFDFNGLTFEFDFNGSLSTANCAQSLVVFTDK